MNNFLGTVMLNNELIILPAIVAIGFVGWLMLMLVQLVWLDEFPSAKKESSQKESEEAQEKEYLKAA